MSSSCETAGSKVGLRRRLGITEQVEWNTTDLDFYWLGRVPCRSVRLVGTIVGIRDYETRRMYSSKLHCELSTDAMTYIRILVDDGTAVIDCIHRPLPPLTPSKKRSLAMSCPGLPPPLPPPVTSIGLPVAITGVPRSFRQTKQLVLDEISKITTCHRLKSLNFQ